MNKEINPNRNILIEDEPFSISQVFINMKNSFVQLLTHWKKLSLFAIIGGIMGVLIAWFTPTTYTAKTTFVVEEAKSGGSSILSSLAGQTGLDIASLSGGNGLFSGDNVLLLLKSTSLVKKSLLTPYDETQTLADAYANVNHLKQKWKSNSKINKEINFGGNLTRLEDSLLQTMMYTIINKEISITRMDKKVSIFELLVTSKDEKFSYLFATNLLKKTAEFYIDIKVGNLRKNVVRLQERADSLLDLLDKKTFNAAEATSQMLNGNRALPDLVSSSEISTRNKTIQTTVYTSLIQNLELSKTSLIQQTPVFQNLDNPEYPLKISKTSKLLYSIVGAMIAVVIGAFSIFIKPTPLAD